MKDYISVSSILTFLGAVWVGLFSWWYSSEDQRRKRDLMVLVGAGVAALGGFWGSVQQSDYERELRRKSDEIAQLNRTMISHVTGGDSYCYIKAGSNQMDARRLMVFSVWQVGEYPCFDVAVQIKDVDEFSRLVEIGKATRLRDLTPAMPLVRVGTVLAAIAPVVRELDLQGHERRRFGFVISLRNGWVFQKLLLRKSGDEWKRASHIEINLAGKERRVVEEIDVDFPRATSGQVEW